MASINLVSLTKKYRNVYAVKDVNLTIEDQEFVVIVGASGCGKTTTLRMIAGLEKPTSGDIYIGETRVNDLHPKYRDVSMVFQNYALYPHMNVFQNMAFGLKLRRYPRTEIEKRVNEAARMLGLEALLNRRPKQLSGGQRQRVAMGRAMVRSPQVYLFDEPLSNLDAKMRVEVREELLRIHEKVKTTVIYVTHDQVEAMTLAHRIVLMHEGDIVQVGAPMELYNHPHDMFVAGFIGSPSMNFLDAVIVEEDQTLWVKTDALRLRIPEDLRGRFSRTTDREVVFGMRPEHFYDVDTQIPNDHREEIEVVVDLIETVGAELHLVTHAGKDRIRASINTKAAVAGHREKNLLVDMSCMHIFDKDTGVAMATTAN
jgi:multiple sugar transport system ATP-binding protein